MTDTSTISWLATAARIGARIVNGARWDGESCSWQVHTSQQTPGVRQGKWVPASPTLYQGTSGIALFLIELYGYTREQRFLDTALGALRNSEIGMGVMPAGTEGFHSGRTGVAYTFYRAAVVTGRDDLMTRADRMLRPVVGRAGENPGLDVIAGAAGAVPVLLNMADRLPAELTTDLALRLGDLMIARANQRRSGWSWGGMPSAVDDLCGFAHGAAGFAHAFVELFNVTGDALFRHGAEQAMAYEAARFDATAGNWPDLRHYELSEYTSAGAYELLRARLRAGERFPSYEPTFNTLWCHGAPGIGLSRLRAVEVLGDSRYEREATVAAETTLASVQDETQGYSLCHGQMGNCETLIEAARVLGRADLREAAERRARTGAETFEYGRRPWRGGTIGGLSDPSLLLGDAGIGYFYLRLHDAATPSILCPTTGPRRNATPAVPRDPAALRERHASHFFGATMAALRQQDPDATFVMDSDPGRLVSSARENIRARIAGTTADATRARLERLFAIDEMRLDLDGGDRTQELLATLGREPVSAVDWTAVRVQLAPAVRIAESDDGTTTAAFRQNNVVSTRPLAPFASVVLGCAREPGTVADITERAAQRVEGATPERFAAPVLEQVKHAYESGLLCVTAAAVPAGEAVLA